MSIRGLSSGLERPLIPKKPQTQFEGHLATSVERLFDVLLAIALECFPKTEVSGPVGIQRFELGKLRGFVPSV